VLGAINSALPFILFAWAAQRAPAGIGAIANAMTVPFTTLIAFLFFGERIGVWRSLALAIGFTGVVWARLILGEALTSSMAVAGAMILGSVAIAQRAAKS
jgi:drug/metabolite transporter (DMT)-like permease